MSEEARAYETLGRPITAEALVIGALMRKLGTLEINVEDLDLREPKGLVLSNDYIRLEELDERVEG